MCGIVAIISQKGDVEESALRRGMHVLNHRGPDGEALWISDDRSVGLGHKRLSIIGLNNGSQPIANEDRTMQIVVNGEFYDFEKIRNQLQERGHNFRTESDAEIALHLYEEHGVGCLKFLRGEFAFIIWDAPKKRLFAARDRFGIKPLNYAERNGLFYFASEAKALFAAGVNAAWDKQSVFHSATMQYVLPDRTLFDGINQLRPGHYLIVQDGNLKADCYWDLDYATANGDDNVREEALLIEQFSQHLEEAVRLRLRADIPICCHLSGGLDSSAILGLAAKHSPSPIQCFSVTFDEPAYDELSIAKEMAGRAGGHLHPVHVQQEDLIAHLSDAVYFSEGLAVNGHLTAKYLLHKEIRRKGFKVALTGEGSDEVVAGYPHLRVDLFRSSGQQELLANIYASNRASQGIMLGHGESLSLDSVRGRLGYVPSFLEAKGTLGYKLSAVLSPEFRKRFLHQDSYESLLSKLDVGGQISGRQHVYQSLYIWCKTALANYILKTLGDGTELANSVEGRLPFLDHHLFEFVRQLPLSLKIKGSIEKYVLREAARPVITETVYRRQKHPFVAPPLSCFAGKSAHELLQDKLRSKSFSSVPFLEHKKFLSLLDSIPDMTAEERAANDPVFMTALSMSCLQERFGL